MPTDNTDPKKIKKPFSKRANRRLLLLKWKKKNLENTYMSKDEFSSKEQKKNLKKQNKLTDRENRISGFQRFLGRSEEPKG
tara:strand:+ start:975 stop:1217 length:243 start_codon:yes stop_codon:yes gene_type:complete